MGHLATRPSSSSISRRRCFSSTSKGTRTRFRTCVSSQTGNSSSVRARTARFGCGIRVRAWPTLRHFVLARDHPAGGAAGCPIRPRLFAADLAVGTSLEPSAFVLLSVFFLAFYFLPLFL